MRFKLTWWASSDGARLQHCVVSDVIEMMDWAGTYKASTWCSFIWERRLARRSEVAVGMLGCIFSNWRKRTERAFEKTAAPYIQHKLAGATSFELLVALRGTAAGALEYLPTKQHPPSRNYKKGAQIVEHHWISYTPRFLYFVVFPFSLIAFPFSFSVSITPSWKNLKMSQNKVEDVYMMESSSRIQTRRTSRSARSASPVMEEEVASPVSSDELNPNIGSQATNNSLVSNGGRVTRSQSVESSGYETTDSRKRKRKAKSSNQSSNKKRVGNASSDPYSKATPPPSAATLASATAAAMSSSSTPSMNSNVQNGSNLNGDGERETRNTAQRISKEAREAKKAQRDLIIKERQVENQCDIHKQIIKQYYLFFNVQINWIGQAWKGCQGWITLWIPQAAERHWIKANKDAERGGNATISCWGQRQQFLQFPEIRCIFAILCKLPKKWMGCSLVTMVIFKWDKLALRRSMIQHVQHKINTLEQEYYSNHVQSKCDWLLHVAIQKIMAWQQALWTMNI